MHFQCKYHCGLAVAGIVAGAAGYIYGSTITSAPNISFLWRRVHKSGVIALTRWANSAAGRWYCASSFFLEFWAVSGFFLAKVFTYWFDGVKFARSFGVYQYHHRVKHAVPEELEDTDSEDDETRIYALVKWPLAYCRLRRILSCRCRQEKVATLNQAPRHTEAAPISP
ncbi:hypothetical protein PAXINDRAFT_154189 [Paxillus involutus ATCC 200175]|nr:hypothetical protein PAXINDRAFT_154189 [Paxillus involutus ATCC 200175]